MEKAESILIVTLIVVNLLLGIGVAVPLAKLLGRINNKPKITLRYFAIAIGIYFIECIAFAAGMATQVFSVGLAFIWGITFGFWLRFRSTAREVLKTSFFIALYTCLPTISFLIVLFTVGSFSGLDLLSAEEAVSFGIPEFLHLPWPLNTILGFFGAITVATVVFKSLITTGEVGLIILLSNVDAYEKGVDNVS